MNEGSLFSTIDDLVRTLRADCDDADDIACQGSIDARKGIE